MMIAKADILGSPLEERFGLQAPLPIDTPEARQAINQLLMRRRAHGDSWTNIGDVAELAVWDAVNRAKDRRDEAIDAMRMSNGMTLDQYLESVTAQR